MGQRQNELRAPFHPQQIVLPRGDFLAQIAGSINGMRAGVPMTSGASVSGLTRLPVAAPPLIIGVAVIADDANECEVGENGDTEAPCRAEGRYKAKFLYSKASETGDGPPEWEERATELRIDASIYEETPRYKVGDMVPAYYDPQRLWCIPIQSPRDMPGFDSFIGTTNASVNRAIDQDSQDERNIPELNNATQFSLWLFDEENNIEEPYGAQAPDLVLVPSGIGQAGGGSQTVIVLLSHYDSIGLRAVTSGHTRINMQVPIHGMHIRWLRRIEQPLPPEEDDSLPDEAADDTEDDADFVDNPALIADVENATVLGEFTQYAHSAGRFKTPKITNEGDSLRVEMPSEDEQWAAEITFFAEVIQTTLANFVLLDVQSDSPGNAKQRGELVEGNEENFFDGVVINGIDMEAQTVEKAGAGEPSQRCWLTFVNRYDDPDATDKSIAEQGVIYGPCQYIGSFGGDTGEERPVFACMPPKEEWEGKTESTNGTVKKGETADFLLIDGENRVSDIKRTALVKWNDHNRAKKALISRFNRKLISNQIECGTNSSQS